jgi:hypothetical protein
MILLAETLLNILENFLAKWVITSAQVPKGKQFEILNKNAVMSLWTSTPK